MWCPHCESADTSDRRKRTAFGYRRFRCHTCKREFNERTGTSFNHLQYPTDVVCLVVLWRVRYKLSLRDLPEMFLERGLVFTHEAVREWEAQLAPLLSETLRKHRRGRIGCSWYVDETFIKVKGRLVYLYRAIDRHGNLVDVRLSEKRDKAAAQAFLRSARTVTGHIPARIASDGHDAYPGAIKAELGEEVRHRTNRYLNNHLEQDHRGIKQRIRPMGASRVWRRPTAFAGRMTKCGTSCAPRSYRNEGHIARATATSLQPRCALSKPNPREFIGGFDLLAIACIHGDARKGHRSWPPEANPETRASLLLESIALRHQIAELRRSQTRRPASVVLIACFGCSCRAGGRDGVKAC